MIGLRVGPFEIVEHVRVPEPGEWFLARRTGMTRRQPNEVFLRVLRPDASASERAELQQNFEALRAVDDPRVPSAVAFYEGSGALAMGVVHGKPLTEIIDGRRNGTIAMSPPTLVDIAIEIAEVLQKAHHRARIHGHLGPEMVWIGSDGRIHMFGFGCPGAPANPRWSAPERARGGPTAMSSDLWSHGALMAAMITGHPPWRGEDPLAQARTGDPESMVAPVETQWPALGRLLRRMLDPHPQNRFASLHPVLQELLALTRKAGGTSARRELGAALWSREDDTPTMPPSDPGIIAPDASPAEAPDESAPPPSAPVSVEADPPSDVDPPSLPMAELEEHPSTGRSVGPLPDEQFDVVAPSATPDSLPIARFLSDVTEDTTGVIRRDATVTAPRLTEDDEDGDAVFVPERPDKDPMDPPTLPPNVEPQVVASLGEPRTGLGRVVADVQFDDTDPDLVNPTGGTAVPGSQPEEPHLEDPRLPTEPGNIPSFVEDPELGSISRVVSDLPQEPNLVAHEPSEHHGGGPLEGFPIERYAPWFIGALGLVIVGWILARFVF